MHAGSKFQDAFCRTVQEAGKEIGSWTWRGETLANMMALPCPLSDDWSAMPTMSAPSSEL
eukprot:2497322-Rhodomonas_salina.3